MEAISEIVSYCFYCPLYCVEEIMALLSLTCCSHKITENFVLIMLSFTNLTLQVYTTCIWSK